MEIAEKYEDNSLVLELSGDLMGGADSEKFRAVIDKAIRNENVFVVVDLAQVSWMNSSGLGMLISALTSLRSAGGDLVLASLSERLRRPIQITKLDSVFQEFETVSDAIASNAKM
ncbi:STAS domain-containing protein [candidate division KSB1 bacterium]|nr:STAS domain-containing protein [candidate division KSB1 bacterium]